MWIDTKASHFGVMEPGPTVCPGSRRSLQPYAWQHSAQSRLYVACSACGRRFGTDDVWSIHNRGALLPDHANPAPRSLDQP